MTQCRRSARGWLNIRERRNELHFSHRVHSFATREEVHCCYCCCMEGGICPPSRYPTHSAPLSTLLCFRAVPRSSTAGSARRLGGTSRCAKKTSGNYSIVLTFSAGSGSHFFFLSRHTLMRAHSLAHHAVVNLGDRSYHPGDNNYARNAGRCATPSESSISKK